MTSNCIVDGHELIGYPTVQNSYAREAAVNGRGPKIPSHSGRHPTLSVRWDRGEMTRRSDHTGEEEDEDEEEEEEEASDKTTGISGPHSHCRAQYEYCTVQSVCIDKFRRDACTAPSSFTVVRKAVRAPVPPRPHVASGVAVCIARPPVRLVTE